MEVGNTKARHADAELADEQFTPNYGVGTMLGVIGIILSTILLYSRSRTQETDVSKHHDRQPHLSSTSDKSPTQYATPVELKNGSVQVSSATNHSNKHTRLLIISAFVHFRLEKFYLIQLKY